MYLNIPQCAFYFFSYAFYKLLKREQFSTTIGINNICMCRWVFISTTIGFGSMESNPLVSQLSEIKGSNMSYNVQFHQGHSKDTKV